MDSGEILKRENCPKLAISASLLENPHDLRGRVRLLIIFESKTREILISKVYESSELIESRLNA